MGTFLMSFPGDIIKEFQQREGVLGPAVEFIASGWAFSSQRRVGLWD